MYEELLRFFYRKLTNDEQNALMVYKSKLGLLINSLDGDPDFEEYYDEFVKRIKDPRNLFIKNTIFSKIDISSLEMFKESIFRIKKLLDSAISKIRLPEDVTVYRFISSNKPIKGIAKSNIVSTSLSPGESFKYAVGGENIHSYTIHLEKGSVVGVMPYEIDFINGVYRLNKNRSCEEIVLNLDNYDLVELSCGETKYTTFFEYYAKPKQIKRRF